ncbi:MAG: aminopeptidase N [Candidatus Krumholzibacteriia bacterium]
MPKAKPQPKFLKDYRPSGWLIDTAALRVELGEDGSVVHARLALRRNPDPKAEAGPLVLQGRELETLSLAVDGRPLAATDYQADGETLTLPGVTGDCVLESSVRIHPESNTSLEGLYRSGGNFCTQCEAEGFRKITWFLDRPDVMARYTVRIEGEKARYPVLLSNGNLLEEGALADGRHFAVWEDPYPKPSYLFALVAGDLVHLEDRFTTRSGREVTLRIYVRANDLDKTAHAMRSLKKSMQWDEETFGLEYDLDVFNIVAVSDFNMGAMENKSLNIFNSKYVMASEATATDGDYVNVEGVIAHEYFHNWTGNRVTLSSWFHLSLKEGLTVFRDQQFTADMNSAAVKRIDDVRVLRASQFPEDAGPMAHPIRPASYIEMNNFYTTTVYEKGAEVIRMIHTLLGPEGFRKGMDLYFERHDGQAVTTDDFVAAMEDASGVDLGQFRLWYDQAGTPTVGVRRHYDAAARRFTLTVSQRIPDTPGQTHKKPMHIPLALGLLDPAGREIPLRLEGESAAAGGHRVLDLREAEQRFVFEDVPAAPVPSVLRGFSAPVHLDSDLTREELSFLMGHDPDSFNRWEAGQQLATGLLLDLVADHAAGRPLVAAPILIEAFRNVLDDTALDPALAAMTLILPDTRTLSERLDVVDPEAVHGARKFLRKALGEALHDRFEQAYAANTVKGPYGIDAAAMGRRSLKNVALGYLLSQKDAESRALAMKQYRGADNMTDAFAAFAGLANQDCPEREEVLADFYATWREDELVMDKWFSVQATSSLPDTLENVRALTAHPAFDMKNPNKVRALISAFAHGNLLRFNAADGGGYRFVAERVLELDALNPQVAARLVAAFNRWTKFDGKRQVIMRGELERIVGHEGLSRNVYEIVSKALAMAEAAAG